MIKVAKHNGDFSSLQEAILSIPDEHSQTIVIQIEPGIYEEKVYIRKSNIKLIGQDRDTTIIRWNDGARKLREDGTEYGTFNSSTMFFSGKDITVENLTIENSAGPGQTAGQAVAAHIVSDRTAFYNCAFIGYQDTIFTGNMEAEAFMRLSLPDFIHQSPVEACFPYNRNYFENCIIWGDVDYIFGPSTAYFNKCALFSRLLSSESTSYITAASTPAGQEYGYVFYQCTLTGEGAEGSVYLGRPWRDYAKTAFLQCSMDAHIHPEGWHNWGRPKAEVTATYLEYGNFGKGADTSHRAPFSRHLYNEGILEYFSCKNVLAGEDGWEPRNSYL